MLRLLVLTALLLPATTAHARHRLLDRLLSRWSQAVQPTGVVLPHKSKHARAAPTAAKKKRDEKLVALVKVARLSGASRILEIEPHTFSGGFHGTHQPPEVVLRIGLKANGTDRRLDHHVDAKYHRSRSAFRGTTPYVLAPDGESGAALWAGTGGYVYDIRDVPTWDVNAALEGTRMLPGGIHAGNLLADEHEYAIPGTLSPRHVKRWAMVERSTSGRPIIREWHDNPGYVGAD